jgi:hypothetical protein
MYCLNVVRMVVSPCPSHAFGIPMIGNDVGIICELLVADGADPILLDNLSIHQLAHFSRRSKFAIPAGMMRIFNSVHAEPDQLRLWKFFPAAAGNRSVNGTKFIGTEPHGFLLAKMLALGELVKFRADRCWE